MDLYPDMYLGTDAMRKTQMVGPKTDGLQSPSRQRMFFIHIDTYKSSVVAQCVLLYVFLFVSPPYGDAAGIVN